MLGRRKVKKPKRIDLTFLELAIINHLIKLLPNPESIKLKNQIEYLPLIRRTKFKSDVITELFPISPTSMPDNYKFSRREEFQISKMKIEINLIEYDCTMNMVLGELCDIIIKPIPPKNEMIYILKSTKISSNLTKNIH